MSGKHWAVLLALLAISSWFFPQWNGFFFERSEVSTGEGRIIAAIFFVGSLLLWYLSPRKDD